MLDVRVVHGVLFTRARQTFCHLVFTNTKENIVITYSNYNASSFANACVRACVRHSDFVSTLFVPVDSCVLSLHHCLSIGTPVGSDRTTLSVGSDRTTLLVGSDRTTLLVGFDCTT